MTTPSTQVSGKKRKKSRNQPQYELVASRLKSRIFSGDYRVGSLLPTEHELCDEFGLSRQTIREALRNLMEHGLITRQPGIGTRVVRQSVDLQGAYSIASMAELEDYAGAARLRVDSIDEVKVEGDQARLLECSDGALWIKIEGIRYQQSDNFPIGITQIFLRAWFPGIEEHLRHLSGAIHTLLQQQYDTTIEEISQDVRATLLTAADAKRLMAEPGAPALEVVRRYFLADEKLVLRGRIIYPADRFGFSLRFLKTRENP